MKFKLPRSGDKYVLTHDYAYKPQSLYQVPDKLLAEQLKIDINKWKNPPQGVYYARYDFLQNYKTQSPKPIQIILSKGLVFSTTWCHITKTNPRCNLKFMRKYGNPYSWTIYTSLDVLEEMEIELVP